MPALTVPFPGVRLLRQGPQHDRCTPLCRDPIGGTGHRIPLREPVRQGNLIVRSDRPAAPLLPIIQPPSAEQRPPGMVGDTDRHGTIVPCRRRSGSPFDMLRRTRRPACAVSFAAHGRCGSFRCSGAALLTCGFAASSSRRGISSGSRLQSRDHRLSVRRRDCAGSRLATSSGC